MTPQEEARIGAWSEELTHDVQATLVVTDDERTAELRAFCEALSRLATRVGIAQQEGGEGELPGIGIHPRVHYRGVPLGRELEPFLGCLAGAGGAEPEAQGGQLAGSSATLKLYVAQQCAFCPLVVEGLWPLAVGGTGLRLDVIDCELFAEAAVADRVQAVPTLILGRLRLTGTIKTDEVAQIVADPSKLKATALGRLLEQGNADVLVAMMLEQGRAFAALVDLLSEPTFSTRLAAMAVMEKLVEQNRSLAAQLVEPLWHRFEGADDQVRGDILYVVGEAGQHNLASRLQAVLDGPYSAEVKEAAEEALEVLGGE